MPRARRPPRKPSKANLKRYNVEQRIKRKVEVHEAFEEARVVLSADPEGRKKAYEQLKQHNKVYTVPDMPSDPEEAKRYEELCNALVDRPAVSMAECIMKAGAAMNLVIFNVNEECRNLPRHVTEYIDYEYSIRAEALQEARRQQRESQSNSQAQANGLGPRIIDEGILAALISDPLAIEEKTFKALGSDSEDTKAFRVVGSGRSNKKPFWEVRYEGSDELIRVDQAGLSELLLGSTEQDG